MRKKLLKLPFLAVLLLCGNISAQGISAPNEFRFGVGDCFSETLLYHNYDHKDYSDLSAMSRFKELQDYRYIPHFFIEYHRSLLPWLSVGAQVDMGAFFWNETYYQGYTNAVVESIPQNCYNISIMPSVRFNWFRKGMWTLYSACRAGAVINTGTELDYFGRKTAVGVAVDPAFVGCTIGGKHWNGGVELGALIALASPTQVMLVGSKLISVSVGYRF